MEKGERLTQVTVRKKTVDATRLETRVPSTTKPNFTVEDGVNIVPVNGLSRLSKPWTRWHQQFSVQILNCNINIIMFRDHSLYT